MSELPQDAPVQAHLEWSEFTSVHVDVNAEAPEEVVAGEVQVSLEIEPAEELGADEAIELWLVKLTLQVTTPLAENALVQPYEIVVATRGIFSVAGGVALAEGANAIAPSAGDALYGSAREMILGLTGRCSNGPFQLPAFDFTDLQEEPPGELG